MCLTWKQWDDFPLAFCNPCVINSQNTDWITIKWTWTCYTIMLILEQHQPRRNINVGCQANNNAGKTRRSEVICHWKCSKTSNLVL